MLAETDGSRAEIAQRMQAAAAAWTESLSPDQRAAGWWAPPGDLASDEERVRWFYTPTDHGGLPLGAQRPAQQQLAMRLVSTGLSPAGYVSVATIMGWENVLDLVEGFAVSWGRERGRDPGLFYVRVFGDPLQDRVWAWRFGGHHVSVNQLVVDDQVRAVTPFFLGADPAAAPALGGGSIRPLASVEDLARELISSFDDDQRGQALLLDRAPTDIVGGNRSRIDDGDRMIRLPHIWRGDFAQPDLTDRVARVSDAAEDAAGLEESDHERISLTASPKGLAGSAMTPAQKELMGSLLETYTGRVPASLRPRIDVDEVHLAWAGSTRAGEPHYYRLQGPRLLAEWDNTQRDANHGHSVWRDPVGDFGLDVLAAHRDTHH